MRANRIKQAKMWSAENSQARKLIEARYRRTHRQQQNLRTQNYRARKRQATVDGWVATMDWWRSLVARFGGLCAYCGKERKLTLEHVVPISRGGLHAPDNIVPACGSCNYRKRNKLPEELGWVVRGK